MSETPAPDAQVLDTARRAAARWAEVLDRLAKS